jgi:flagellar basal-body rod protein FlgG
VSISHDGVVSVTMPGQAAPQQVGNIAMSQFINAAGLEPRGQNLYVETASSGQPQQGTPGTNGLGTIQQGYLEASNVNVVQELVTMIQTQRAYEMNSKAIQTSDQMLAKLAQL